MKHINIAERTKHLLVDQATVGLNEDKQNELNILLEMEMAALQEEFTQTAAMVQLGMLARDKRELDAMPDSVREKILAQANVQFGVDPGVEKSSRNELPTSLDEHRVKTKRSTKSGWMMTGWAVAAALALAFFVVRTDGPVPASFDAQRLTLLESVPGTVTTPWIESDQAGFEQVTGNVVWNDATQTGFMQLAGLPANNPAEAQYQLWIVAPERGEQPVDGGVFDVPAGEDTVIIPITAKLAVLNPAAFAITLEQPGGVVVSKGPLLVVAPASS